MTAYQPDIRRFMTGPHTEEDLADAELPPRFFMRRAHWVRNPNHPAQEAGGVGPAPRPPLPAFAAAPAAPVPAQATTATNTAHLGLDPPPPDKMEILLRMQATVNQYFTEKKAAVRRQITPGTSIHRPIYVFNSDEDSSDEDTPIQNLRF